MKRRLVMNEFTRRRVLRKALIQMEQRFGFDSMLFVAVHDGKPRLKHLKAPQVPGFQVGDPYPIGACLAEVARQIAALMASDGKGEVLGNMADLIKGFFDELEDDMKVISAIEEAAYGQGTRH